MLSPGHLFVALSVISVYLFTFPVYSDGFSECQMSNVGSNLTDVNLVTLSSKSAKIHGNNAIIEQLRSPVRRRTWLCSVGDFQTKTNVQLVRTCAAAAAVPILKVPIVVCVPQVCDRPPTNATVSVCNLYSD